jgi:hypothetical protein
MSLEPGIERTDEFTVADRLLTDVGTHERRIVERAGFGA